MALMKTGLVLLLLGHNYTVEFAMWRETVKAPNIRAARERRSVGQL